MPYASDRSKQLKDLHQRLYIEILNKPTLVNDCELCDSTCTSPASSLDSTSTSDSDGDDNLYSQGAASELLELYVLGDSTRYFEHRAKFDKSKEFANKYFESLRASDFQHITRMDKPSFWALVNMIEDHTVFHNNSHCRQVAVSLQLAVTLDRLGHYGNGVALKRSGILWGTSTGSIVNYMRRCLTALESALIGVVQWPNKEERSRISSELAKKGFRGCVGLVDGTTLPLSQRPAVDGEVYFDRKKRYSLNMQIICDDRKKILHMYTGLPGSCADSTSLQASPLWSYVDDPRTFCSGQYLLGDSGYPGLSRVVSAFRYGTAAKDPNKEAFNYCLARTRVVNEHCIGILKSRWHSLKELKTQLKVGSATTTWTIRQIECCVRLHNFVHNMRDEWSNQDAPIIIESDPVATDDEVDNHVSDQANYHQGTDLRQRVMDECLLVNRNPGGYLV